MHEYIFKNIYLVKEYSLESKQSLNRFNTEIKSQ